MANVADVVVSGGVALAFTLVSWAVKALFNRERDRAAGHKDDSEAFAQERETWRKDYDHAYGQMKTQCDLCVRELDKMRNSLYRLMDDLEEQILPALMLPGNDAAETSKAIRTCMSNARRHIREAAE